MQLELQVASIFARVLKLENKADLSSYTDVNASQWYYDDLAKAVDAGLFKVQTTSLDQMTTLLEKK